MTNDNNIFPVEVFSGTIWDAELVKSILEDHGIETFLFDENIGTLAPWYAAGGGAGSVRVMVSNFDAGTARDLISPGPNSPGLNSPGLQAGDDEKE